MASHHILGTTQFMASEFIFEIEDNPVPIVLIFKKMLENALSNRDHAQTARAIDGSFSLVSSTDPQSLTITVDGSTIRLKHGVSKQSKIIIRLDFARMSEPGYKPRITGLFKHPLFAYKVGKFLSFPPSNWADNAKRFWEVAGSVKGMPDAIKLTSTNEGRELTLGEGENVVEILGSSTSLSDLFSGSSVLINELLQGNLQMRGTLKHMTVLSGVTLQSMMGGLDHA
jgi:hypothetical protein